MFGTVICDGKGPQKIKPENMPKFIVIQRPHHIIRLLSHFHRRPACKKTNVLALTGSCMMLMDWIMRSDISESDAEDSCSIVRASAKKSRCYICGFRNSCNVRESECIDSFRLCSSAQSFLAALGRFFSVFRTRLLRQDVFLGFWTE